jgi:hypothetical protein
MDIKKQIKEEVDKAIGFTGRERLLFGRTFLKVLKSLLLFQ